MGAFTVFDGLNAAGRIASVAERLMEDSGLREKFETTGRVAVQIRMEEYVVDIMIRRLDE